VRTDFEGIADELASVTLASSLGRVDIESCAEPNIEVLLLGQDYKDEALSSRPQTENKGQGYRFTPVGNPPS